MPITQINEGNGLNQAGGKSIRNKSKFVNKFPVAGTYRFGEYSPCFCAETVADDNWKVHVGHEVISGNLKAPLLQEVMLKKDFFWVPDMCILPMNWEKFFVNPVKGQDVPDDVGCSVKEFPKKVGTFLDAWQTYIGNIDLTDPSNYPLAVENSLKWLLVAEMFYSEGNLLSALNYHMSPLCSYDEPGEFTGSFDQAFDYIIGEITGNGSANDLISILWPGGRTSIFSSLTDASRIRAFLSQLRDGFDWSVSAAGSQVATDIVGYIRNFQIDSLPEYPCNLRRVFAYQIACAHFFTNDKIDYVYSAELYRQLIYNTYNDWQLNDSGDAICQYFQVNGLTYQYDYCSAKYFDVNLSTGTNHVADLYGFGDFKSILEYLRLVFGFNNSLRYLDYFTGSRSQPLAVGDVNVAVNSNLVNVVDVAAKTMAAKMLNVANRIGQRVEAYVKEFFGIEMAKDYHNPFWLMHTTDVIGNPETQNTGAAQQSQANTITSLFRQSSGSKGMEMSADRSGVIIGIQYFDIQRVYAHSNDRQFFHVDRFDDFLPYLQYIGDQNIDAAELDTAKYQGGTFAYTGRNMEYKQNYPYCFGGFYRDLKPYIFLADEARFGENYFRPNIGPSFIRSIPAELDRFYTALNGYSLGTYYHFAIVNNVYSEAVRPMAALPGILNG